MPERCQLALEEVARVTLEQLRDHGPKAYLRERAAILLAIAAGASIRQAARTAGLKAHDPDAVCSWVARYKTRGLRGVWIDHGRGHKPAFSPLRTRRRSRVCAAAGSDPPRAAPVRPAAGALAPG